MGTFNRRRPRVVNTAAILAAAITLLTSSVKSQGLATGIATSVTASTTCSNQFASIHASRWSWGDKLACGQHCLQLWRAEGNPEPKIMVQLVGVCQQCELNDLELSSESFDALPVDKNSSSLGIQWQIITCPESLRGNGVIASIKNQTFSPKTSNPSSSPLTTSPSPSLSSSPRPASSSTSIPSSNQGTSSPSSVNDGNASHASNTSRTPSPSRRPPSNTSRLPPRDQGASNTSRTPSPATIPSPSRRPPSNTSRLPPRDQGASPRPSSFGNKNNQSTAVQTPYPNTSPPSTNTPPSPVTSSPSTPSPNTPTSKPLTSSPLTPAPSKQTVTPSPSKPFTPQPGPSPTSTPSSSPSNAKDNAQGSSPMPSRSPAAPIDEDSHGGSSDHQNESPDADKRDTRRPHPKRSESTDGSLTSYSGSGSNVTDSSIGDVTSKPPPKQGDTSRKGSSGGDNGVQPTGSSGSSGAPGTSANDTNSKSKFFTGGFFTSPIFIGLFMGLIGFVGLVITYRAKKQRYSNPDHDQMIPNSQSPSVSAPLGDELGVATSRAMYTLTSPINIRSAISTFQ